MKNEVNGLTKSILRNTIGQPQELPEPKNDDIVQRPSSITAVPTNKKTGRSDCIATLLNFKQDYDYLNNRPGKPNSRFVNGDITNVHDMMVAVEKATNSFKMMMEIRNNVIEAYREMMGARV